MQKIIKQLFVGNQIFIENYENGEEIEKVSKEGDIIYISIGYSNDLKYNVKENNFKWRGELINVTFDKKQHRSNYLQKKINELKKDNEQHYKKILENWDKIRKYQSEYMEIR